LVTGVLLRSLLLGSLIMADRAYDTNAIRQQIQSQGAVPGTPSMRRRLWSCCFSPFLYRRRNAIERMFCRLQDFGRVATRYDRLAQNFRRVCSHRCRH
jgi:transposase